MEISDRAFLPHPLFLDILFLYKLPTATLFKELIRFYSIDHIALSYINTRRELITLSSTPAIEFNLFKHSLWQKDRTYDLNWCKQSKLSTWDRLYDATHYEELFYIKQLKPNYSMGFSLAVNHDHNPFCSGSKPFIKTSS